MRDWSISWDSNSPQVRITFKPAHNNKTCVFIGTGYCCPWLYNYHLFDADSSNNTFWCRLPLPISDRKVHYSLLSPQRRLSRQHLPRHPEREMVRSVRGRFCRLWTNVTLNCLSGSNDPPLHPVSVGWEEIILEYFKFVTLKIFSSQERKNILETYAHHKVNPTMTVLWTLMLPSCGQTRCF